MNWIYKILSLFSKDVSDKALAFDKKAVKAIKAGATDFILKPWQNEKLLATISSSIKLKRSRMEAQGLKSRQQEISSISRSLKGLAKELDIPVIALSQLSRALEQRSGDHKPLLSDLRESGAIEQDADLVMFIYRAAVYGIDPEYTILDEHVSPEEVAEIIVRKNRNGPIGTILLHWIKENTKFHEFNYVGTDEYF